MLGVENKLFLNLSHLNLFKTPIS